jgi:hypothetical protein
VSSQAARGRAPRPAPATGLACRLETFGGQAGPTGQKKPGKRNANRTAEGRSSISGGTVSTNPAPSSVTGIAFPVAVTADAVSSRSVLTASRSGPGDWMIAHAWFPVAVHRTHGSSELRATSGDSGRVSWIAGAQ